MQGAKPQNAHKTGKVNYGFHLIILTYTISSIIFKFPLLLFVSTQFISTCNSTSSQRGHGHLPVLSLRPPNFHIPSLNHAILLLSCMLPHTFFISQYATKDQFSFIFPTLICLCMKVPSTCSNLACCAYILLLSCKMHPSSVFCIIRPFFAPQLHTSNIPSGPTSA